MCLSRRRDGLYEEYQRDEVTEGFEREDRERYQEGPGVENESEDDGRDRSRRYKHGNGRSIVVIRIFTYPSYYDEIEYFQRIFDKNFQ